MRPPPSAVANGILIVLAVAFVAVMGEFVLRATGGVGYGGWGDPASIHLVKKQYYANSHGLRDREIDYDPAPNEFRILCLGDSFTWGQMVPANSTYPKVIERTLSEEHHDRRRYTVINAGQLGWSTVDEARWFQREGTRYRPQILIVGFFLNDPEKGHYEIAPLLSPGLERYLTKSYFYFFLKYRIHLLKARFRLVESYQEYLKRLYGPASEGWRSCEEALGQIDACAHMLHARMLVVVLPAIEDWSHYPFEPEHAVVRGACEARGIAVLDLLDAFRGSNLDWRELRVGPNDDHPNKEGHKIIASAIVAALEHGGLLGEATDTLALRAAGEIPLTRFAGGR
jgi:lysophospholipase L1-like esterase